MSGIADDGSRPDDSGPVEGGPDSGARRREVVLAGHAGDIARCRAALSDGDAMVRAAGLTGLARNDALGADDLAAALGDPSSRVRHRAVTLTASRPGDEPPSLASTLEDTDPVVVETAAWACGERRPPEAGIASLLARVASTHEDALVREAAVAALGAVGDPVGLPAVLAALSERAAIRRRAVVALAAFDGPEVDAALRAALTDRDRQVRQAAEDLIG